MPFSTALELGSEKLRATKFRSAAFPQIYEAGRHAHVLAKSPGMMEQTAATVFHFACKNLKRQRHLPRRRQNQSTIKVAKGLSEKQALPVSVSV
jgi:hypothetical protein